MSYARDRKETIAALTRNGVSLDDARRVLRCAATLQRLAVAVCNGDWPADNGERRVKACAKCEGLWVPSVLKCGGVCPDCRTEARLRAILAPYGIEPSVDGDPRGYVVKAKLPDKSWNTWGGVGTGWGVAARE